MVSLTATTSLGCSSMHGFVFPFGMSREQLCSEAPYSVDDLGSDISSPQTKSKEAPVVPTFLTTPTYIQAHTSLSYL